MSNYLKRQLKGSFWVVVSILLPFVVYEYHYISCNAERISYSVYLFGRLLICGCCILFFYGLYNLFRNVRKKWVKIVGGIGAFLFVIVAANIANSSFRYLYFGFVGSKHNFTEFLQEELQFFEIGRFQTIVFIVSLVGMVLVTFDEVVIFVAKIFDKLKIAWEIFLSKFPDEEDYDLDEPKEFYYHTYKNAGLNELAKDWRNGKQFGAYLLVGEEGSGKTTFLKDNAYYLKTFGEYEVVTGTAEQMADEEISKTAQVILLEDIESIGVSMEKMERFAEAVKKATTEKKLIVCTSADNLPEKVTAPMEVIRFYPTEVTCKIVEAMAQDMYLEISLADKRNLLKEKTVGDLEKRLVQLKKTGKL